MYHRPLKKLLQSDLVTTPQLEGSSCAQALDSQSPTGFADAFSLLSSRTITKQDRNIPTFPNNSTERKRFESFQNWPSCHIVHPFHLVMGVFFLADLVRCFWCGLDWKSWKMGDDPIAVHDNLIHNCPLLQSYTA